MKLLKEKNRLFIEHEKVDAAIFTAEKTFRFKAFINPENLEMIIPIGDFDLVLDRKEYIRCEFEDGYSIKRNKTIYDLIMGVA